MPYVFLIGLSVARDSAQTVESPQLGTQSIATVELGVAVHAVKDLGGTSRVQVVLHHEVQELPKTFADLVHELRKRDFARDQTLAGLGDLELPQPTVGVPDYEPRDDFLDAQLLLRHYGPFLAP